MAKNKHFNTIKRRSLEPQWQTSVVLGVVGYK